MDLNHRASLISSIGEEVISQEDLKELLQQKPHPVAYNGFEPSGKIHIAQSVLVAINMNKLIDAGCKVKMFVADWHAQANNKLGGDLDKIQTTGKYFIEVWKACGMKLDHVEFVWASDLVKDPQYWQLVVKVAMLNSVERIKRCSQIMGRGDEENLSAAQILYPCMQAADIFYMNIDICQLGMDQRKVNVLAREVAPKLGYRKPVVVSHHMLLGLLEPPQHKLETIQIGDGEQKTLKNGRVISINTTQHQREIEISAMGMNPQIHIPFDVNCSHTEVLKEDNEISSIQILPSREKLIKHTIVINHSLSTEERATAMKMSKSIPDSAIFATDTIEEVENKIKRAYCPAKEVSENPILEYCKYIIFEKYNTMTIDRPEKFGGPLHFKSYAELEGAYAAGNIHPADLKVAVIKYVNLLLQPIRDHFAHNEEARKLKQLVESYTVTR